MKRAPGMAWTDRELDILREVFPQDGAEECVKRLPGRTISAVIGKAFKLELKTPKPPAALRAPLKGQDLERAVELRRAGWSYMNIALDFGCCVATATNAILYADCLAGGHPPARRDSTGAIVARDLQRMRDMMMAGMKSRDIQVQLGVSASCVSNHRRKFAAELRAQRKGKSLPPPGGGQAYSGRKIPREIRRQVEELLLQGYGAYKVAERTGVSKTHVLRARTRLIRKLRRKGECLAGCDIDGRRIKQKENAHFIPAATVEEFRRRLLDGSPVQRAAIELGIGGSAGYRLRDQLRAELEARGEALPPLKRRGRNEGGVARDRWLPKEREGEYRRLSHQIGPIEARRQILEQIQREKDERALANVTRVAPKLTFEEQLARARAGARITSKPDLRTRAPDMTLGGVATGQL